jgi:uncharacterized protein YdeI (YjbR/CyaY-like superfamily)
MNDRMNRLVTKVHAKEKRWATEFAALRRLCLASGLNEELKWGQACYDLDGGKVVLIHGFFSGAKQSATRAARVEKHAPRILKGLGLGD